MAKDLIIIWCKLSGLIPRADTFVFIDVINGSRKVAINRFSNVVTIMQQSVCSASFNQSTTVEASVAKLIWRPIWQLRKSGVSFAALISIVEYINMVLLKEWEIIVWNTVSIWLKTVYVRLIFLARHLHCQNVNNTLAQRFCVLIWLASYSRLLLLNHDWLLVNLSRTTFSHQGNKL